MWGINSIHVLVLVVNLDHAQKLEVAILYEFIIRVIVSHLKQTVEVAFIYDTEAPLGFPLHARANDLYCLLALALSSKRSADQIPRQVHVNVLRLGRLDTKLLRSIIEVQLVGEVGREQVRYARMDCEAPWEALDSEVYFPFHLLPIIAFVLFIEIIWILTRLFDIYAFVHRCNEVIDDLHHFGCVSTQEEALHRSRIDIPVKIFEALLLSCFYNIEDEVEAEVTLATLLSVLVSPQLHHLEVIKFRLLLRIKDLDLHLMRTWFKEFLFELCNIMVKIDETSFILPHLFLNLLIHFIACHVQMFFGKFCVNGHLRFQKTN